MPSSNSKTENLTSSANTTSSSTNVTTFDNVTLQGDPPREGRLQLQSKGFMFRSSTAYPGGHISLKIRWTTLARPKAVAPKQAGANHYLKLSKTDKSCSWKLEMPDPSEILRAKALILHYMQRSSSSADRPTTNSSFTTFTNNNPDGDDSTTISFLTEYTGPPKTIYPVCTSGSKTNSTLPLSGNSEATSSSPSKLVVSVEKSTLDAPTGIEFSEGQQGAIYISHIQKGGLFDNGQGLQEGMRVDQINRVSVQGLGLETVQRIVQSSTKLSIAASLTDETIRVCVTRTPGNKLGLHCQRLDDDDNDNGLVVIAEIPTNSLLASSQLEAGMILKSVNDIEVQGMEPAVVHALLDNIEGEATIVAKRMDPNRATPNQSANEHRDEASLKDAVPMPPTGEHQDKACTSVGPSEMETQQDSSLDVSSPIPVPTPQQTRPLPPPLQDSDSHRQSTTAQPSSLPTPTQTHFPSSTETSRPQNVVFEPLPLPLNTRSARPSRPFLRRSSANMKYGCNIPEAEGLFWQDSYFDDRDDVVAVFDRTYPALEVHRNLLYIKLLLLLGLGMVAIWAIHKRHFGPQDNDAIALYVGVGLLVFITFGLVYAVGRYRIQQSNARAMHVAVVKDGILISKEHQLRNDPILAGLLCLDRCILVGKQEETIPFDQVSNLTSTIDKARVPILFGGWLAFRDMTCCCAFDVEQTKVVFEAAVSGANPEGIECSSADLRGLIEAKRFEKLIWGMKRFDGEQIVAVRQNELQLSRGESATHPGEHASAASQQQSRILAPQPPTLLQPPRIRPSQATLWQEFPQQQWSHPTLEATLDEPH